MGAESSRFIDLAANFCLGRGKHALPDLDLKLPIGSGRITTLVSLEHLNVNVPEWDSLNHSFWLKGLGLVLDSRAQSVCDAVQSSGGSMKGLVWANAGLQQIHMPLGEPPPVEAQKPPGVVGLAFGDIMGLRATLRTAQVNFAPVPLKDQMSNVAGIGPAALQCTSPTGVKIYAHGMRVESWLTPRGWYECEAARNEQLGLPSEQASVCMGIPYIRLQCPVASTEGIARFYQQVFDTKSEFRKGAEGTECWVPIGAGQWLIYQEIAGEIPYDGYHIAVYVNRFVDAYRAAQRLKIVWNNSRFPHLTYDSEEDAVRHCEFRILKLVDPETSQVLCEVEHEIRALSHGGFCAKAWLDQDLVAPNR